MGGLWVDYNLMNTVPGRHVLGEANFSKHGTNRLHMRAITHIARIGRGYLRATLLRGRNADLIVELSPGLDVVKRATSDAFWEVHERLEREFQITHARQGCPHRNGPVVEEWTPERGWRVVP